MLAMFSKRKGRSRRGGVRRRRSRNGNNTSKEAATSGNNASKEVGGLRSRKTAGSSQAGRRRSPRESSNSDTSGKSHTRPQRKSRRRRRRARQIQKEIKAPNDGMKLKVRKKQGPWRGKPKRVVPTTSVNVMCSDSSGSVSHVPLSSNSCSSQPGYSHSSNFAHSSHVSPMECSNMPWANLDVPMDLSLLELEVNDHGVDFDLQARKNHLRWLANLQKARE